MLLQVRHTSLPTSNVTALRCTSSSEARNASAAARSGAVEAPGAPSGNKSRLTWPSAVMPLNGSFSDTRQPANKSCSGCETFELVDARRRAPRTEFGCGVVGHRCKHGPNAGPRQSLGRAAADVLYSKKQNRRKFREARAFPVRGQRGHRARPADRPRRRRHLGRGEEGLHAAAHDAGHHRRLRPAAPGAGEACAPRARRMPLDAGAAARAAAAARQNPLLHRQLLGARAARGAPAQHVHEEPGRGGRARATPSCCRNSPCRGSSCTRPNSRW